MKKFKKAKKNPVFWVGIAVALCIVTGIILAFGNSGNTAGVNFDGDKMVGIDVSSHNGDIDWDEVQGNVDFAFIRVGYRGYGNGEIKLDTKAKYNIKNATKNDIPVGVYFYSQAISEEEAIEEAEFVLDIVDRYDIALPIVIDFEYPYDNDGKITGRLHQAKLTAKQNTDIINAFCSTVEKEGYQSGVYASSNVLKFRINADQISQNALLWVAEYSKELSYNGDFDIWQYTKKGNVDGVNSKYVDINYWYYKE